MAGIGVLIPYYLTFIIIITATIFTLIVIGWSIWNWLIGKEVEAKRIIENANR